MNEETKDKAIVKFWCSKYDNHILTKSVSSLHWARLIMLVREHWKFSIFFFAPKNFKFDQLVVYDRNQN